MRGLRRWLVHEGPPAFTWLWWSQSVSLFGSQVTLIAIPLLAAISLRATAWEMGLLAAIETVPYLAFSMPAGILTDRLDRRWLLIASNLARAALLLAIPTSALLGYLSLPLLYAVAFAVGTVSVLFDVAYQSYIPDLLEREELLGGNQRIELSESAARTVGPGLGGALVASVGGAMAIVVDAVSYLIATLALLPAKRPQAVEHSPAGPSSDSADAVEGTGVAQNESRLDTVWDYVAALESRISHLEERLEEKTRQKKGNGAWAGLGIVFRDRVLRDMAASTATFNLASSAILAVFILFAATEIGMDAASIGLLLGGGNIGFVVGALAVGVISSRYGLGRTLVISGLLGALATILLPLAAGAAAVGLLFAGRFIGAFAIPLFNVNARALRQSRAPREALGRVNAVFRLVDWGTLPIGALLGGWVGNVYGLRTTLIIGGLLGVASAAWLIWSPLRHVRRLEADLPSAADVGEPIASPALGSARPTALPISAPRPTMLGAAGTVGWPLTVTGRLPTVHWPWLAIGGVAIQLAILPPISLPVGDAAPVLYVASSAAVLVCVVRNIRIPGLAMVALGGASNLIAIVANGGFMPVSPEAARAVGHTVAAGYTNTVELANAALKPLTDIIVVPPPLPIANVYSIGDLLILVGLAIGLASAVHRQTRVRTPDAGLANASTRSLSTISP